MLGNSPRGGLLTQYLLEQGVISLDGELYVLRSGAMGINWVDLRENRIAPQV